MGGVAAVGFLEDFARSTPLPPLYRVAQRFDESHIGDIAAAVDAELAGLADLAAVGGLSVGIALGSRGIACIDVVARAVTGWVRSHGGRPFILPAMGSHGGATAAGQRAVLAHLGITESSVGAPIHDSMAVRPIGEVSRAPVYWSEEALGADRLVLVNRVKPHTAFRGTRESGLTKMLAVGLGKREGAETLHGLGPERFADTIPAFAAAILRAAPPVVGLALVENAYHQLRHIEGLASADFPCREPELLAMAWGHLPRLPIDRLDALIVDEIGKDISGDGMDPNVTGRFPVSTVTGGASIGKIAVLDLTESTGGNGNGIGLADFTTRDAVQKIDWQLTCVNALSGKTTTTVKLPLAADSRETAAKLAIKTSTSDPRSVRLIRIRNTLQLTTILASESLIDPLTRSGHAEIVTGPVDFWSRW
jgi:hypothetical protein